VIGLAYLAVGGVYLALTVWLTKRAAQAAKRRGIAGWKWGLPVVLAMYLLVFWDWVPTVVAHRYYCAKYAGFTVYKTLEQWKAENPGVAETLVPKEGTESAVVGNTTTYELNQRFAWDMVRDPMVLGIKKTDSKVVDKETGEVLAQYIDFSTDIRPITVGARSLRDYKFWMASESCESDVASRTRFYEFESTFENLGGHEQ